MADSEKLNFNFQLSPDEYKALSRLAQSQHRTRSGQIRFMICEAAAKAGVWNMRIIDNPINPPRKTTNGNSDDVG